MIRKIYAFLLFPAFLLAAPTAPSDLQFTALSAHSVQLSWQAISSDNKGFKIFRNGALISRIIDSDARSFEDTGLSPNTTYTYEVKATDDETPSTVNNIINRHNLYRSLEFTDSNLTWDEALANHAQTWAIYLSEHYTKADQNTAPHASIFQTDQHHEDDYKEGENIAWSSASMPYYTPNPVDINDVAVADTLLNGAIDAWASEKAYYDYATNTNKQGYENKAIGHYTQIAWQKSTKIGCGKAPSQTDLGGEWVVCRYAIAGNLVDTKPYCSNYTVSDLYTVGELAFTSAMINGKSFAITKIIEDRAACTRNDHADSTLSFTGTTSANIPQYDAFNAGDNSNLWPMNFDNISIDADGILTMTNANNDRYMTLKLIGETATDYNVEAYWWVNNNSLNRRAILKLAK